jgi:hypothetical protein
MKSEPFASATPASKETDKSKSPSNYSKSKAAPSRPEKVETMEEKMAALMNKFKK